MPAPFRGSFLTRREADPFLSLHREMNRLFDDMFRGFGASQPGEAGGAIGTWAPALDVSETEGALKICADLPGLKPEDIQIDLQDDVLSIRGERREERRDDKENFHLTERSVGSFARTLRLPFQADPGQVQAQFTAGVLTLTIPKPAGRQQGTQRIQIQSGDVAEAQGGSAQGGPASGQPQGGTP
jgi:HSP20 family protein